MLWPPSTIHPSDEKGWGHQVWRLAMELVKPNGYEGSGSNDPSSEWMPRETCCDGAINTAARLDGECAGCEWYNDDMNILYKLTFPNGKVYIGITTESLSRRVQRHINYARENRPYALSAAIRKYGERSFTAEHIASAKTKDDLACIERILISQHDSICPNGYNMTGGGEGTYRVKPSEETRKKISDSLAGRNLSESHRIAVGLSQKGKVITSETRDKMSKAAKARCSKPMSEEQRQKRRDALIGRKQSQDTIAKKVASRKANGSY